MIIKNLSMITLGIIIGTVITAFILYPQIGNRYKMGVNTGYIQGGNTVIEFLAKNIINDIQGNTVTVLGSNLHHKVSTLSVIEINGVKTISIK